MPGYVIIETLKLIRSPIKKTRLWAQKKASDAIKGYRQRRGEGKKAGLSGEDAWMYFGESVIKHDLIPIFDENLRGLATAQDLTVPSSELAMHQRAAGFHIQAFAWDKPRNIAYVVYQPSDRAFGYISGLTNEVLSTSLTSLVERTFGPGHSMKSESMRAIHGGEWSRGVVGATDVITAARDKWEAIEKRVKEMLPIEKRHKGLQELSDADLGPVYDHILMHVNEYATVADVPKSLLLLARRYVRMHSELLKNIPKERIYQQYGAVMGEIIEMEMTGGFAVGSSALSPKPVGVYRDVRLLGVEELVFRSRPYKEAREMPPELIAAIRDYVRIHPEDIRSMSDREMVMRFGWGFYHAAQPEITAIQGQGRGLAGREEEERPPPEYQRFVREGAINKLTERYRVALRENWSRHVSAAFTSSEVQEAVGDLLYLTDGTAFAIQDLNRRELENALEGLNIQLPV